jgi:hypothetical protein
MDVQVNNHKIIGAVAPAERIEVTLKLRRKSEQGCLPWTSL